MFVLTQKPYTRATTTTISQWVRTVISQSGEVGSGGSVRGVITSTASDCGVTLENILQAGDWARTNTFRSFYYEATPLSHLQPVLNRLFDKKC